MHQLDGIHGRPLPVSEQQRHILHLQDQHRFLLGMTSHNRRSSSPGRFCCPSTRPRAPLPQEVAGRPGLSYEPPWQHPSTIRNLNPYIRPKRSSSVHGSERLMLQNNDRRMNYTRSVSLENDSEVYYQEIPMVDPTVPIYQKIQKKIPPSSQMESRLLHQLDNSRNRVLAKRQNNTYPPYPSFAVREKPLRRSFKSLFFGSQHQYCRWDEDPCLLRPHSPELSCPHDPRSNKHTSLDEGSCFVVGQPLDSEKETFRNSANLHGEHHEPEENAYSYAGEGILSPAEVIKAQASSCQDSDSYGGSLASENIYEEIPDEWESFRANNRKSLVEEVFGEYERIRARWIHSTTNLGLKKNRNSGSIVTLDFGPHELSASPDSGLTISTSETYSDGLYDPVCSQGAPSESFESGLRQVQQVNAKSSPTKVSPVLIGKPPIPKLSRTDTMDVKTVPPPRPDVRNSTKHKGDGVWDRSHVTKQDSNKKESIIRGHLRSSGRGLKLKLDGVMEKIEQSRKMILNKAKKDKRSVGEEESSCGGPDLTPPLTPGETRPPPPLTRGGERASRRDSRSSHSSGHSGHTVGGDDDYTEDKSMSTNDRIYESLHQADELTGDPDTSDPLIPDDHSTKTKSDASLPSCTSNTKPELKSYFGKSMLPGLSGLHGLSSLRHSAHNLSKTSPASSSSSQNRASTGDTCFESGVRASENGALHGNTKVSPCSGANGSNSEEIAWVSRRLQAHRQLSSSDSWGSEDFESYSSNEEDSGVGKEDVSSTTNKPCEVSMNSSKLSTDSKVSVDSVSTVGSSSSGVVSTAGREKLKARLLRKREQWRERRQSSSKEFRLAGARKDSKEGKEGGDGPLREGSIEDVHAGSGGADTGKLSRWFSLRKSVNYEVDRKPGSLATPTGNLGSTHPLPNRTLTKSHSDNDGSNIPSNDLYPNGVPNSSTLSSISSFSSNSSSSTNSSSSSFPHHHNSSHHNNLRMPQLLELEERMSELEASTNPSNFYRSSCGGLGALGANTFQRKHQPPSLPPIPPGLAPEQIKRRHIVASIVHSENNYVATLHRLVREYRKPLDDSKPPILNQAKVATLFHYVHEILQCHTMFRIALTDCVRHWDRDEKIGDVFFASFSKGVVLDIYSEFINNFSRAMELAKLESRKKSAFADFLKMRQITSPDRLSFFGMMVKPVQRFPQFILFLQDLLKHTPKGHHDRMSLQLALTQLESLAENLNEQKRESEQHQAFKATLKQINSKFALRNISEGNRCLIRQDDVTKLEFGPNGLIKQTKERRLFLTTDTVICVSVVPKTSDDFNSQNERLSLKWVHPITDIEVQESNSSLTLSRLLAAGLSQRSSSSTTNSSSLSKQHNTNSSSTTATGGGGGGDSVYDIYNNMATTSLEESEAMVGAICAEMNDLMHDYQVVSRIAGLVGSLKGSYDGLNGGSLQGVMGVIQQNIQARDDRMSWLDGCCLQIRAGKEKEVVTFHVQDPTVKKDWIIELRLAQLAVSSVNSPAWDSGDLSSQPPSRRPLFVTALPILHAAHHTQVVCGCQYPLQELPKSVPARGVLGAAGRRGGKTHTSVWLCSTDGVTSHITRYVTHLGGLRECIRVSLREICVTGMLHVPPAPVPSPPPGTSSPTSPSSPPLTDTRLPLALDTVWIGTLQNRLMVYSGNTSDAQEELCSTDLPAAVSSLIYHCEQVFIGLTNGQLLVYQRAAADGCWRVSEPIVLSLSDGAAVTALLPLSAQLYAAVADTVMVLDCASLQITKQLSVHHGQSVSLLAHSGIGLWVCEAGSSTVCLYHTESCRHLQDIDLAPCVARLLGVGLASIPVIVTALVVSRGLLWVGTSVGVTLTLPLPRLQGVPIISGRPTLSYHAHNGPVTFLMTLMPPEYYVLPKKIVDKTNVSEETNSGDAEAKQPDDDSGVSESNSTEDTCTTVGKKCSEVELRNMIRKASTLPRGFGGGGALSVMHEGTLREMSGNLGAAAVGSDDGEVMGLCGELLRHWSDEGTVPGSDTEAGDSLRRSDPSLSCISTTLDRRLRLRAGRPRSLDLSSASIDSKVSAATTSSGSEDGHTAVQSRQSTIHENLAHDPIPEGDLSRKNSAQETVGLTESGVDCIDKAVGSMASELKASKEGARDPDTEDKLKKMSTCSNDSCLENSESSMRVNEKMNPGASDSLKLPSENSTEQAKSSSNLNIPTSADSSTSAPKSPSVKDEKESKRRGSHRRSSSDVTQKSLSSSTSNISSLYYDGDVDMYGTTKSSSSSSSNPTKSLKRSSAEKTSQVTDSRSASKVDVGGKDPAHANRKGSVTNTLNRNISTLSRTPTAKSTANGKGGATAPNRGSREVEQPRTVLVLAGGQGYKCIREDTPTNGPPHNNTDAHILVWEMKL